MFDIVENIELHRAMFNLPEYVFPTIMVCYGHPNDKQKDKRVSSRFDQQYICFTNNYRRLEKEELSTMFRDRDQKECKGKNYLGKSKNFGQHTYLRKAGASFSEEMRRSVKVALQSWTNKLQRI